MCASCSIVRASPCSARVACWPGPMFISKIAGSGTSIPALKKSAATKLGIDLHRRSQLSPRFYPARHLEPDWLSSGSSCDRAAQEREDFGGHGTVEDSLSLPAGDRLQRFHLLRLPGTTGPQLSTAGSHPNSGQCYVPQRPRYMGLVRCQSPLAGSSSTAALLPRAESNRAIVETHPPNRNS